MLNNFANLYLNIFGGDTALLSKGDWKFPQTENVLAIQSLGEEIFFKMDTFNLEDEFKVSVPSIEETIKNYKDNIEGSVKTKKQASSGITFI